MYVLYITKGSYLLGKEIHISYRGRSVWTIWQEITSSASRCRLYDWLPQKRELFACNFVLLWRNIVIFPFFLVAKIIIYYIDTTPKMWCVTNFILTRWIFVNSKTALKLHRSRTKNHTSQIQNLISQTGNKL